MHRRTFLKAAAAGVVGGLSLSAAQPAAAFRDAKPDHVTLTYDEERLNQFRPVLIDPPRQNADERPQEWYGWIAESPEYDYDVYVYCMKYRTQRGATRWDSHRYDREPIFVYVNRDLAEVREVTYTAYHWLANQETSPPIHTEDGGEHVRIAAVAPWNHYVLTDRVGDFYDVEPLGNPDGGAFGENGRTTFETWLDTGWRDAAEPGVFQNPDIMRTRESFWADGRETLFVRSWRESQLALARLGIEMPAVVGGAPESDLT